MLAFTGCDQTSPDVATAVDDSPIAGLEIGDVIPGRYIVVLDKGELGTQTSRTALQRLATDMGADAEALVFTSALTGFAAELSSKEAAELALDERVEFIEPDRVFGIEPFARGGKKGGGGTQPAQSTPYGITRVNGGGASNGRACVLDTGIDLNHPDLNVNTGLSRTFITSGKDRRSADDRNGHGTHVAGTIAALDNGIGVVGVAAGAEVVAIKVLDGNGSGSNSGVIAGVDYVADNGTSLCSVANMSLGGGASTALDNAVKAAAATGVKFALAAGNSARDASTSSPARANGANIYTISAIDSADRFASFSNFGNPPVDYATPGVSIYSTYLSGGYATLSGTSMAAPHAAGILLFGSFQTDGNAVNDPDGNADPIMVR